jgi:hypothetical protein
MDHAPHSTAAQANLDAAFRGFAPFADALDEDGEVIHLVGLPNQRPSMVVTEVCVTLARRFVSLRRDDGAVFTATFDRDGRFTVSRRWTSGQSTIDLPAERWDLLEALATLRAFDPRGWAIVSEGSRVYLVPAVDAAVDAAVAK